MKGVIASIHPEARVIDISHEINPQRVREGAYVLWSSYRFFPAGTVFVSVVDPGVGTGRKIILLRTGKHFFLAPDNGILDLVRSDEKVIASCEVKTSGSPYVLSDVSATFHGRDIFAPVAAYCARGVSLEEIGTPASLRPPDSPFVIPGKKGGVPVILHIDRFGNIVTNIRMAGESNVVQYVRVRGKKIGRWIRTYEEAPPRTPCLIVGSSGLLEIVMENESAQARLKATMDSPVRIQLG